MLRWSPFTVTARRLGRWYARELPSLLDDKNFDLVATKDDAIAD